MVHFFFAGTGGGLCTRLAINQLYPLTLSIDMHNYIYNMWGIRLRTSVYIYMNEVTGTAHDKTEAV